jgi:hypothetical protein
MATELTPQEALLCPQCGHHVASIAIARRKREPRPATPADDPRRARVAELLAADPNMPASAICTAVGGRKSAVLKIVRELRVEPPAPPREPETIVFEDVAWPDGFEWAFAAGAADGVPG